MDSRHLIDPELLPLLDLLPGVTITHENLAEFRAAMMMPNEPDDSVSVEILTAAGPQGAPDISLHLLRPAGNDAVLPTLYHIHGGGFVGGSPASFEGLNRQLVKDLGCAIVSVAYRLAPETRFPGAIEDCYAGLAWTYANAARLGLDTGRLGIMGESAGGGLAAALCLMARDRGEYRPAFQHLVYPMLDDRTATRPDPHPFTGEFTWHAANNLFGWTALLGHRPGEDGVSPYAAPSRADDLSNLPPTFITTGSLDLFLEEDVDYARRLSRAGVPIELHVFPGGFHGYDLAVGTKIADLTNATRRASLKRALWGDSAR